VTVLQLRRLQRVLGVTVQKASAKSGERSPRFFISALLSTTILPVEEYVGAVSSAIRASSFGMEHALFMGR
jgi:hypothetical protein